MHLKEVELRVKKIFATADEMGYNDLQSLLIRCNANMIYLSGTVVAGYAYVHRSLDLPIFFLERPSHALQGYPLDRLFQVRKPELIPEQLSNLGFAVDHFTALEQEELSHSEFVRLSRLALDAAVYPVSANPIMMRCRMTKTDYEVELIRCNAKVHAKIYADVPKVFKEGMTEKALQIELERLSRKRGSIGIFRCFGPRMEIFMGNVTSGDNAQVPAPYDFAMGGPGTPGLPMGAAPKPIRKYSTVMVDMAGSYGSHNTDITRSYRLGDVPDNAKRAHELSRSICRWFEKTVRPGFEVAEVYKYALEQVKQAKLEHYFMGTEFQAKFVGHGVGIQINEQPVLMARSKDVFQKNMIIALEPKFVIPGVGPVGIENTYLVTEDGVENLSPINEELSPLI